MEDHLNVQEAITVMVIIVSSLVFLYKLLTHKSKD